MKLANQRGWNSDEYKGGKPRQRNEGTVEQAGLIASTKEPRLEQHPFNTTNEEAEGQAEGKTRLRFIKCEYNDGPSDILLRDKRGSSSISYRVACRSSSSASSSSCADSPIPTSVSSALGGAVQAESSNDSISADRSLSPLDYSQAHHNRHKRPPSSQVDFLHPNYRSRWLNNNVASSIVLVTRAASTSSVPLELEDYATTSSQVSYHNAGGDHSTNHLLHYCRGDEGYVIRGRSRSLKLTRSAEFRQDRGIEPSGNWASSNSSGSYQNGYNALIRPTTGASDNSGLLTGTEVERRYSDSNNKSSNFSRRAITPSPPHSSSAMAMWHKTGGDHYYYDERESDDFRYLSSGGGGRSAKSNRPIYAKKTKANLAQRASVGAPPRQLEEVFQDICMEDRRRSATSDADEIFRYYATPGRPRRMLPQTPASSTESYFRPPIARQLPVPEIQVEPETPSATAPPTVFRPDHSPAMEDQPFPKPKISHEKHGGVHEKLGASPNKQCSSWRAKRLSRPDFSETIRQSSIESMDRNSPPCSITPPPHIIPTGSPGYQPAIHANVSYMETNRGSCKRRPSLQSAERYVETECTCSSRAADIAESSSAENLESKSSDGEISDTEEGSITPRQSIYQVDTDSGLSESIPEFKSPSESSALSASSSSFPPEAASSQPIVDIAYDDSIGIGMGIVKFSVQYFPLRKRLRVSVKKAESLAHGAKPDKELNPFFRVYLMPGKIQKQQSRTLRNTRAALVNEEFFFDNVSAEEITEKILCITAYHEDSRAIKAKEDAFGEIELALSSVRGLMTKKEINCQRALRPKMDFKKLGKLQIWTSLEKQAKCFSVNVIKADDLPKYPFIGTPDPFVRIEIEQDGKTQRKQTRVLKGTCNPNWKEAVMFLVNVQPQALEVIHISVAVLDNARSDTAHDNLIGEVLLGIDAREKTELDQWRHTLTHMGKECKATHHLKRHLSRTIQF